LIHDRHSARGHLVVAGERQAGSEIAILTGNLANGVRVPALEIPG
jgi:hypothetical protein